MATVISLPFSYADKEVSTSRLSLPVDKVILQEHGMRRWGIRKKVLVVTLVPTLLTTLLLGLFFTYSWVNNIRSEEHTSELQSRENLVCRLLLEKKKRKVSGN